MNGTIIKRDCHVKLFGRRDSDRCWHILRNKCMNERLKQGIHTDQIAKRKKRDKIFYTELLMKIATYKG